MYSDLSLLHFDNIYVRVLITFWRNVAPLFPQLTELLKCLPGCNFAIHEDGGNIPETWWQKRSQSLKRCFVRTTRCGCQQIILLNSVTVKTLWHIYDVHSGKNWNIKLPVLCKVQLKLTNAHSPFHSTLVLDCWSSLHCCAADTGMECHLVMGYHDPVYNDTKFSRRLSH